MNLFATVSPFTRYPVYIKGYGKVKGENVQTVFG